MPQKKEPLPLDQQNKSYMYVEPTPAPARPQRKAAPAQKMTRPPRGGFNVPSVLPRRRMMKA